MAVLRIRVWLPDRPGALGAVASRLGALRGDVVRVDVIERGVGQAVDEFVVELPGTVGAELLQRELGAVDDVRVEAIEEIERVDADRVVDVAVIARILVAAAGTDGVTERLVEGLMGVVRLDWAAVLTSDNSHLLAASGATPGQSWIAAFVAGHGDIAGGSRPLRQPAAQLVDGIGVIRSDTFVVLASRELFALRPAELALIAELVGLADQLVSSAQPRDRSTALSQF